MERAQLRGLCAILPIGLFLQQPAISSEIPAPSLREVQLSQSKQETNEGWGSEKKGTTVADIDNSTSEKNTASAHSGYISIKAHLAPMGSVIIYMDHMWTKGGVKANPNEIGATEAGMIWKDTIKNGETKTFKVAPGVHEIAVSDDVYGSEPLKVEVSPGETQNLLCGNTFKGFQKAFYKVKYIFHSEIPGKDFYYVKKVPVSSDHK